MNAEFTNELTKNAAGDDLNEISQLTGINIWQQSQEILEKQALEEIELFTKKNTTNLNDVEEGEVIESTTSGKTEQKRPDTLLDIEAFIKRQEVLKKVHDHKKAVGVSEKSKLIANKISIGKESNKRHNKRKIQRHNAHESVKKIKLNKKSEVKLENSNEKNCYLQCDNNNKSKNDVVADEDYVPSDISSDESDSPKSGSKKQNKEGPANSQINIKKIIDDGGSKIFKKRMEMYYEKLENEISILHHNDIEDDDDDVVLKGGLKIPVKSWSNLYSYQQYGVEWLWKLHQKDIGGLLGDEMGLGKTVQVIVFLMSLQYSVITGRYKGLGPTLIICPATVLFQWVEHFHEWAPEIRVAILHHSGSFVGNKNKLIKEINEDKGVLITTYSGILNNKGNLIEYNWHYLILDEGHKIRNPSAKVTVALKQFRTPNRLLLTGSPMQNNLQELWSLFDFIIPGILGTLQTFTEHFVNPILQGGYNNSTQIQELTAQSVASALKDIISPYLLRRSKAEVQKCIQLPYKSEQVLFCSLTDEQYDLYKGFLMSEHVNQILGRGGKNWFSENRTRANVLVAITTLRKICNHPDLYLEGADSLDEMSSDNSIGFYKRSGKMVVVSALLKMWKKQQHRVLLFTQTRGMITIFENFLTSNCYNYLKMDGSTSVTSRQTLINKFNTDKSFDIFLLTTRVGGLGVNLTGADRVIIYDPDWNPATDTQARERAWRIGQEKQVTVYRLVSAGTIEEKMYQRQVWKQLLSNKVLLDPKTQKIFKTSDLHDLFSLQEQNKYSKPETTNIFRESMINMQERLEEKKLKKINESKIKINEMESTVEFSDEKIEEMKMLAKRISQRLNTSENNKKEPKSLNQLEIQLEKEKRLREKEELKKLNPTDLLNYNRNKLQPQQVDDVNTIDDEKLENLTFEKALKYSEKNSKLYNNIKMGKLKEDQLVDKVKKSIPSTSTNNNNEINCKKSRKDKKKKSVKIDTTGTIDGKKIEGLVKREIKKVEKFKEKNEKQDMFILEKLFAKKGVHSALKHDEIVKAPLSEMDKLRVSSEAKRKADLALEALRKSRLDKWRW